MFLPQFREMVRALMRKPDGRVIPLEVAALGLVGEVGEFMKAQPDEAAQELGDCLWYICAITELVPGVVVRPSHPSVGIYGTLSALSEDIKKHVWHDKDLDASLLSTRLSLIFAWLEESSDDSLVVAQRSVIDKLKKRWPNGFGVQP